MPGRLNEQQRRCVDSIVNQMKEYLEHRYVMTVQANPRYETAWPSLQWLQLQQLRNTLSGEKMWGPTRYVVGEVLCSNDKPKIRELFQPTNQVCIQTEVVEKEDKSGHKTADILDIHDFKTLYAAIDPNISTIASVIQIYMWWDLRDASELCRFHFRIARYKEMEKGVDDTWQKFYRSAMKRGEEGGMPSQEEILDYECEMAEDALSEFIGRRESEPGYMLILAQRPVQRQDSDHLIETLAREIVLLGSLDKGQSLDDNLKQHFARALGVSADQVSDDAVKNHLRNAIADGKTRLRSLLMEQSGGGELYNFKLAQAEAMKKKFQQILGERAKRLHEEKAARRAEQQQSSTQVAKS